MTDIQNGEEKKNKKEIINNFENNSNQNELYINIAPEPSNKSQILISKNKTNVQNNPKDIENINILITKKAISQIKS